MTGRGRVLRSRSFLSFPGLALASGSAGCTHWDSMCIRGALRFFLSGNRAFFRPFWSFLIELVLASVASSASNAAACSSSSFLCFSYFHLLQLALTCGKAANTSEIQSPIFVQIFSYFQWQARLHGFSLAAQPAVQPVVPLALVRLYTRVVRFAPQIARTDAKPVTQ